MITVTLPNWLTWLIVIALVLSVVNDVLKIKLWLLRRKLEGKENSE